LILAKVFVKNDEIVDSHVFKVILFRLHLMEEEEKEKQDV
jgi:hypothetical protein